MHDWLPDLIRRAIHVRRIPYLKGLFSDMALHLNAIQRHIVGSEINPSPPT
jgi:hypothetical protein